MESETEKNSIYNNIPQIKYLCKNLTKDILESYEQMPSWKPLSPSSFQPIISLLKIYSSVEKYEVEKLPMLLNLTCTFDPVIVN